MDWRRGSEWISEEASEGSDNKLIKEKLGWAPSLPLKDRVEKTYWWIEEQVKKQ